MASGQDLGTWDPPNSKKMLKRSLDECSNVTGNELERVVIVNRVNKLPRIIIIQRKEENTKMNEFIN